MVRCDTLADNSVGPMTICPARAQQAQRRTLHAYRALQKNHTTMIELAGMHTDAAFSPSRGNAYFDTTANVTLS